jgi:hypothetical protein
MERLWQPVTPTCPKGLFPGMEKVCCASGPAYYGVASPVRQNNKGSIPARAVNSKTYAVSVINQSVVTRPLI